MKNKKKDRLGIIAKNKKAFYDYFIEKSFESGIVLTGWEVKSIRAGKVQLVDSYVLLKNREAWLIGSNIHSLNNVSLHVNPDPGRTRKLLLNKKELIKLFHHVNHKGYTCVALSLYWKKHLVKCEIAIAKGKKKFDKRSNEKKQSSLRDIKRAEGRAL